MGIFDFEAAKDTTTSRTKIVFRNDFERFPSGSSCEQFPCSSRRQSHLKERKSNPKLEKTNNGRIPRTKRTLGTRKCQAQQRGQYLSFGWCVSYAKCHYSGHST